MEKIKGDQIFIKKESKKIVAVVLVISNPAFVLVKSSNMDFIFSNKAS